MTKPNFNQELVQLKIQKDTGANTSETNDDIAQKSSSGKTAKLKKYWLGLNTIDQDNSSPEVVASKRQEFQEGADQAIDLDNMPEKSRRKFLALMTAGGAFAITACSDYRDKGYIVPHNQKPEFAEPGIPYFYASSFSMNGLVESILVKVREGRPIKIEANPDAPYGNGKISAKAQASILNLYNPGRLKRPYTSGNLVIDRDKNDPEAWKRIYKELPGKLNKIASTGKEIAIVTNTLTSPSFVKVLDNFSAKYPTAKVYSYEQAHGMEQSIAWQAAYGTAKAPKVNFDKAKLIVSLDNDFLGTDPNATENTFKFSQTRNIDDPENFSRLYVVEGPVTITGAQADYRMRISPEDIKDFALAIASEVQSKGGSQSNLSVSANKSLKQIVDKYGWTNAKYLIDDIIANRGNAVVLAGSHLPADTQYAVSQLNEIIGGTALFDRTSAPVGVTPANYSNDVNDLRKDLSAGRIGALITVDTDLMYHTAGFKLQDSLSKAELLIALTPEENETSYHFLESGTDSYILPITHYLESWGDHSVGGGTVLAQQPIIKPLWPNTRQKEEFFLSLITGQDTVDQYMNHVKSVWNESLYPTSGVSDYNDFWNTSLHDGFNYQQQPGRPMDVFVGGQLAAAKKYKGGYTVQLLPGFHTGDGRYMTNGFLMEAPQPISKISWDNHASISQPTAIELGVEFGDMIEVDVNGRKLELPVVIQPGMADKLVAVEMGWGREHSGPIAEDAGFNASLLMGDDGETPFLYSGAKVTATGNEYQLVSTQEQNQLDDTSNSLNDIRDFHKIRNIVQEATVKGYNEVRMDGREAIKHYLNPHAHDPFSITEEHKYPGLKWQMAVDMNKCTGCTACVLACYVENNIPVVGKEEVGHGREMSWMRIDRYYSGTPENPEVSQQPMLCQHCDNAPCENVCPVVATTHSPDGLNQMVYNRCVGTRYCMNNCPYKVRRFNFYDFRDNLAKGFYYAESMDLMMNPEVTVRSRGVVEKCTFCVQRIKEKQSEALTAGKTFKGSQVTTACQDACPAEAIYFGDYNEEGSVIKEKTEHPLGYGVLDFLAVRPNVTYIARLRNVEDEPVSKHDSHDKDDSHSEEEVQHG